MKSLRRFIEINTVILAAIGLRIAFNSSMSLPVKYEAGEPYQSLTLVHLLAVALAGTALALMMQSRLTLIGELRRLALWLSVANGLISLMALLEQMAFGGSPAGWILILTPLAAAAFLAWMALRPLRPEEIAAEIDTLKIPDEIRQGLLRQIGEAAAQEERNRLARDLHDSIKQQLFSINVGTATAQERWERDPEGARAALADVRRSAREAMVEMQAMLHQLRPEALSTAGLIEALREQCEALGYRTGAEVTLELGEQVPDDRMPPGAPEALFRMGQEMLANVARHARARKVRLWLGRQDEDVMLRILDDGQGFDPAAEASGMGLRNLKERAASLRGKLEVASAPGLGAGLTVRLPLLSPPLPAPADSRRMLISEFLYMTVQAGLCISPLGFVDYSMTVWWFWTGLALMIAGTIGWFVGRPSPRGIKSFVNRKLEILTGLFIGWWWVGIVFRTQALPRPELWVIPFAALLYAAFALSWVHRVSEVRRFWRKGARIWLGLILPVEVGILAALGKAFSEPHPLVVNVSVAFFLVAMGIVFPYLISRQRRIQGAAL
ncbi:MAG TPA: sensor histidine kinase [Thermoanaerobaculia bacterium]|jgi:signal transduction histidine kinase|nr:sensor histidine kinase [Thermoanaerobaculia bacterium]